MSKGVAHLVWRNTRKEIIWTVPPPSLTVSMQVPIWDELLDRLVGLVDDKIRKEER